MRPKQIPSFPRRRESIFRASARNKTHTLAIARRWIPAFAGMTLIFMLRGLIWLYQHTLSLFLGRQCRFLPTCSAYADEALRVHGAAKGSALAFRRFCKCHPWTKLGGGQGFDPVPLPPKR